MLQKKKLNSFAFIAQKKELDGTYMSKNVYDLANFINCTTCLNDSSNKRG